MKIYFILLLFGTVTTIHAITGIIQNITIVEERFHPIVTLAYKVNAIELQSFIDPRLKVATFTDGYAYLIITVDNITVTPLVFNAVSVTALETKIFTIVSHNNQLKRIILHLEIQNILSSILCEPFIEFPYGCMVYPNMTSSVDNQTSKYQFTIKTFNPGTLKTIDFQLKITFDRKTSLNYNDQSTLPGFVLNNITNSQFVQSLYSKQTIVPSLTSKQSEKPLPLLATGNDYGYYFTVVHPCKTTTQIISNYIEAAIGKMKSLNELQPDLCVYSP
ncbi:unnamed protein product [Didymodactylos carnosus]|uniref:Uncharacterized protein n=1 Tax=Didymodactylos carnosus TaxID=1234261 RepID=A0A815CFX6_9BILA|nr:unnamed protein product [Didymodactylos carnosus]CAF4078584.1 unnamed protein product [Didymodactylos carnosus]